MFKGTKIELRKDDDFIIVDDGEITAGFHLVAKKVNDTFIVTLPAFDINFYTKEEKAISKIAFESLNSFLNYWKKIKGDEAFFIQMLELGFTASIRDVRIHLNPKRKVNKTEKTTFLKEKISI